MANDKHKCPKNITVLREGALCIGCENCIAHSLSKGDSATEHRRWQQSQYRRELVQPVDVRGYIRANGIEKAREYGYSDEVIRKNS